MCKSTLRKKYSQGHWPFSHYKVSWTLDNSEWAEGIIWVTRISGRYAPFILALPAGIPRAHAGAQFPFPTFSKSHFLKISLSQNTLFQYPTFPKPHLPTANPTFPKSLVPKIPLIYIDRKFSLKIREEFKTKWIIYKEFSTDGGQGGTPLPSK